MAHTLVMLSHDVATNTRGRLKRNLLRVAVNKAMGVLAGAERGGQATIMASATDPASGCTAGISSSGAGAVGIVISAVTLTATWATSDTVSAGLVAAVINASTDAKIQHLYGSTNLKSSLTLVTVLAGDTVTLAGYRFTAITVAVGTIPSKDGDFAAKGAGTDTQSGTSLAGAINRHPAASRHLFALNVAGVVHVYPKSAAWFTGPNAPQNKATASSATITVGSATFAASTHYGVYAKIPGKWANGIVIAASGTGQTVENSNTYISRGLGMDAAPVTENL